MFHLLILITRFKKIILISTIALAALILSGCQTFSFYRQAIKGQYQILSRERPIVKVIADTNTSDRLRERLQLVLELRQFAAKELRLPVNGHYAEYADLGRPYVVWNVYAAPEFSLKSKSWWYPFLGSLDYRGYFSERQAREYAEHLAGKRYDVFVGGVQAYSTLGWFKDPVLNTFLFNDKIDLVETLFHELAHQKVFARGDTPFNESFATAVAQEGVRRWLGAQNDTNTWNRYQVDVEREREFVQLILATRRKLEQLYIFYNPTNSARVRHDSSADQEAERKQKATIIEELRREYGVLKAQWRGYSGYDRWFAGPLNNAQLNTISTYNRLVPAFRQLLQQSGGDLNRFYDDVRKLKNLRKKERHRRLEEILKTARPEAGLGVLGSAQFSGK